MRSALVGCCAAALALVAPGGVGAQTWASAPSIAEERLCRDADVLVCSGTGAESQMVDSITGIDYPGGTYATFRADSNINVECPVLINQQVDKWQCHPPPSAGAILPGIPPGAQVTVVDYKHFAANDPVGVAYGSGLSFLTVAAEDATGSTGYYAYKVCDGNGYGPPAPTAGELAYAVVYGELFNYSSLFGGGVPAALARTTYPILGAVHHANDRDVQVTLQRNTIFSPGKGELYLRTENQTTVSLNTTGSFADSFACTFAPAPGADDPFDYFVAEPSGQLRTRVNGTAYGASEFYVNNPFNETTTYACTCVLPPSKQYTESDKAEFEVCVIVAVTPDRETQISFNRGLEFALAPTMCGGTATAEAIAVSPPSSVLPDEYPGVRLSCIMPYTVPTFATEASRKRRGDSGRPVANLASKQMEVGVFDDSEYYNGTGPDRQCKFDLQPAAVFDATTGWGRQSDLCFPVPLVADEAAAEAKCGPANGVDDCTLVSVARTMAPPFVACACAPPPPPPRGRIGGASNSNSNSNTSGGRTAAFVGGVGALAVGAVIVFRRKENSGVYQTVPGIQL